METPERLGVTWGLSPVHGWGVYGLNLCRVTLSDDDAPRPSLFRPTPVHLFDPDDQDRLAPLIQEQSQRTGPVTTPMVLPDHTLLISLENGLAPNPVSNQWRGGRNFGVTFFEGTAFDPDVRRRTAWLNGVIAGSQWNADVLNANGIGSVRLAHQGVETSVFHPGPKQSLFGDRFVVVSGGKAEFRKGQDIVLEAFRRFHARRPDSVLVTLWRNPWPASMATLAETPFGFGAPDPARDGDMALSHWAARAGLPAGSFIDLGFVRNSETAQILREADVCVFPNRCEGGTNLVAMEALACGAPCVLSAATGHLDLIGDGDGTHVVGIGGRPLSGAGRDGWQETDPDALVAAMDDAYDRPADARKRGTAAHHFMQPWDWSYTIRHLLDVIRTD